MAETEAQGRVESRDTKTDLCLECSKYDHSQHDFSALVLRLCVEGELLQTTIQDWDDDFLENILQKTCAARNTCLDGRPCWVLLIHINNPNPAFPYGQRFAEALTDKFKPMMLDSALSEIFQIKMFVDTESKFLFLNFSIFPDYVDIVAKNLRSPQSYENCLVDADLNCIVQFLFCREEVPTSMFPSLPELRGKSDGDKVSVHESASVEFKSLQPGNKEKKTNTKTPRKFTPTCGNDYVEWLWIIQTKTLGGYIAAFAKIRTGGAFYCGVTEQRKENKIQALALSDDWKREIEEKLPKKITTDMLWVQRDPENDNGYTVLRPQDIRKGQHFDVESIPVQGPSTQGTALYILEVRVASFDGVVFNHKGPEVYRFEEAGRNFRLVSVDAVSWLQKLQQHAWCSKHKIPRKRRCGYYDRCEECQTVWSDGCSMESTGFCKRHQQHSPPHVE